MDMEVYSAKKATEDPPSQNAEGKMHVLVVE
jgi:hypothetical protein